MKLSIRITDRWEECQRLAGCLGNNEADGLLLDLHLPFSNGLYGRRGDLLSMFLVNEVDDVPSPEQQHPIVLVTIDEIFDCRVFFVLKDMSAISQKRVELHLIHFVVNVQWMFRLLKSPLQMLGVSRSCNATEGIEKSVYLYS